MLFEEFHLNDNVAHVLNSSLTKKEAEQVKNDIERAIQNYYMLHLSH